MVASTKETKRALVSFITHFKRGGKEEEVGCQSIRCEVYRNGGLPFPVAQTHLFK